MLFGRIVGLITIYLDFWTSLGLPERPLPSRPCTRTATRGFVHDYRRFNATKNPKMSAADPNWRFSITVGSDQSGNCKSFPAFVPMFHPFAIDFPTCISNAVVVARPF